MDIPNIAAPGPGGVFQDSLNALNSYRNAMAERKYNEVKAQYAPVTAQAEAASKLAYANLMGPQFMAKMLGNEGIVGNLSQDQLQNALATTYRAGTGQGAGANIFSQMQQPQPPENVSNKLVNHLLGKLGVGDNQMAQQANPLAANGMPSEYVPQNDQHEDIMNALSNSRPRNSQGSLAGYQAWASPQNQDINTPTYAENTGQYKGLVKEGEKLGDIRAEDIGNIGKEQLALSNAGVSMDRMIGLVKSPEFQGLRDTVPFFQDKQLSVLSKTGSREQQNLIGDFISTAQKMQGDAVNSFQGKAMQREFDYAQKLKIDENDTVGVAEGKLRALKSLKDIAETKNDIILDLMENQHMNLGQAVKVANKQVDFKGIENKVNELLEPRVKITNSAGESRYVTKAEAKKLVGK